MYQGSKVLVAAAYWLAAHSHGSQAVHIVNIASSNHKIPEHKQSDTFSDLSKHEKSADRRCGAGFGTSCDPDECCSSAGWCGVGYFYCSGPACQIDYGPACDANIRPKGPNTDRVPRPPVGPVPYGEGIYHCEKYGDIALTYDDGPFSYTEELLDLLAKYDARATFYVTGRNLGKGAINDPSKPWADLIRRMVKDGHQVASHTWTHQRLTTLSEIKFRNQILYNEIAFADILGYFPTYLRPPYSASNSTVDKWLRNFGYHITYFNLDTEGYLHDDPTQIQKSKDIWDTKVEGHDPQRTKWLQIEHDTVSQSVHNLTEYMLKSLFANGFRSVTVGECLGDPKENWYRQVDGGSQPPDSKPPTRDGRCGPHRNGATCIKEPVDKCCSGRGWCGNSRQHCGRGCLREYGECDADDQ